MHCTNGLEMAAYAINCRVAIISINCHLLIYETQLLTVIRHNHVYLQLIWMLYVCVCIGMVRQNAQSVAWPCIVRPRWIFNRIWAPNGWISKIFSRISNVRVLIETLANAKLYLHLIRVLGVNRGEYSSDCSSIREFANFPFGWMVV